jgi:hypothetical protein
LKRLGFVAGANEQFSPAKGSSAQGVSIVERFSSPAGARKELETQIRKSKASASGRFKAFPVPEVPGARGFALPGPRSSGQNVAFADGAYYHLVGTGWLADDPHPPTRIGLTTAAKNLYRRLHGQTSAP